MAQHWITEKPTTHWVTDCLPPIFRSLIRPNTLTVLNAFFCQLLTAFLHTHWPCTRVRPFPLFLHFNPHFRILFCPLKHARPISRVFSTFNSIYALFIWNIFLFVMTCHDVDSPVLTLSQTNSFSRTTALLSIKHNITLKCSSFNKILMHFVFFYFFGN